MGLRRRSTQATPPARMVPVSTIHEQCIELDFAVAGEKAAAAGVEGLVVFEHCDGGLDRIDGGGAALQQRVAGSSALRTPKVWASTASSGMAQAPP